MTGRARGEPIGTAAAGAVEYPRLAPGHVASLAAMLASLTGTGEARFFHPHPFDEATLRGLAAPPDDPLRADEYRVALADGVVGYGMLRGWAEGFAVPSLGIAVHPAARGRGVARGMMVRLHEVARRRGAARVRLTVYRDNRAALALYESLGYRLEPLDGRRVLGVLDLGRGAAGEAA